MSAQPGERVIQTQTGGIQLIDPPECEDFVANHGRPCALIPRRGNFTNHIARTTVKQAVPGAFTASATFDVGIDLGSPVSLDCFHHAPFKFDGKIEKVTVELKWTDRL